MRMEDLDVRWHQLTEEVITGMKEWRLQASTGDVSGD